MKTNDELNSKRESILSTQTISYTCDTWLSWNGFYSIKRKRRKKTITYSILQLHSSKYVHSFYLIRCRFMLLHNLNPMRKHTHSHELNSFHRSNRKLSQIRKLNTQTEREKLDEINTCCIHSCGEWIFEIV